MNGTRVGDAELTPGFTEYRDRLQVQTYDVTSLVRPGVNALGAILSDGWYRGQVGLPRAHDQWGSELGFLAQVRVDLADGSTVVAGTGDGWRSARSHIDAADLIAGQSVDLTRRRTAGANPSSGSTAPMGSRRRRRPRLREPGRLARAGRPRGRRDRAGVRAPGDARARVRSRPEHQRLGAAGEPRAGGNGVDADPRRGARRRRRRHHRAPRRGPAVHSRAAAGGPGRPGRLGGAAGGGVRAAPHDARLPVRARRGPSRCARRG